LEEINDEREMWKEKYEKSKEEAMEWKKKYLNLRKDFKEGCLIGIKAVKIWKTCLKRQLDESNDDQESELEEAEQNEENMDIDEENEI
jgi:hypothetical protein